MLLPAQDMLLLAGCAVQLVLNSVLLWQAWDTQARIKAGTLMLSASGAAAGNEPEKLAGDEGPQPGMVPRPAT